MTDSLDTRVVAWFIWGLGSVVVWGGILFRRGRHLNRHRDARALRDTMEAVGLFGFALVVCAAIGAALFAPKGTTWAGLLSAIGAGIFLVVGLYALFERFPDDTANARARRQ